MNFHVQELIPYTRRERNNNNKKAVYSQNKIY